MRIKPIRNWIQLLPITFYLCFVSLYRYKTKCIVLGAHTKDTYFQNVKYFLLLKKMSLCVYSNTIHLVFKSRNFTRLVRI